MPWHLIYSAHNNPVQLYLLLLNADLFMSVCKVLSQHYRAKLPTLDFVQVQKRILHFLTCQVHKKSQPVAALIIWLVLVE